MSKHVIHEVSDQDSFRNSTEPMMNIEGNIPTADIHVDSHGNVVIKNKKLAHLIEQFLQSDEALKIQRAEAHLLCCKLRCPLCEQ